MSGSAIMKEIIAKEKSGNDILLGLDAHQIDEKLYPKKYSRHAVALIPNTIKVLVDKQGIKSYSFKVQSQGVEMEYKAQETEVSKTIYNVVYGNDKE